MSKSPKLVSNLLKHLKTAYNSLYFAPSIVFIALLFITYWSWRASIATLTRDETSVVVDRVNQTQNELVQQFASYEQILTGGAGLVRGSQDVTKNEWHNYVSTFNLQKSYSGIQNIGFVKAFSAAQLPDVASKMQAQGIDFHITPDTPRDFYTAVLYADPERTVSAVGLDMFTEPNRMKAMAAARDSGLTSITPPLKSLLNDTTEPVIYMFVPQYQNGVSLETVNQRQQALEGYVYARLIGRDFFSALISSDNISSNVLELSAKDSTGGWLSLYKSNKYEQYSNNPKNIHKEQIVNIYGQSWKLNFAFRSSDLLSTTRRNTPIWTLLVGLLFTSLLAELIFLLLKARANELTTLKEQAVDLAKDELLSLASHQLRTPATTVKQYLGMVLQGFAGDITPTQTGLLEKAYAGNERQLYIINEMLHVAKIDAGRIVLARHKTDINNLIEDITNEAQRDNDSFHHKLILKLPKQSIVLEVDEHMLRMAIENIVSNAVKYTLPGGKIKVTLRKQKTNVYIDVQDSGIGIEQKDIARLYKLFTRLNNPLTQNISGTGVGLYLAKHLVELHGGSLGVRSVVGRGSTFTIILPL